MRLIILIAALLHISFVLCCRCYGVTKYQRCAD